MENISIIEKIKSNYNIQNILSYIDDKNILTKLFFHSKKLQGKYNINIFDYQEEFFNNRIKWEDYLCFTSNTLESEFKKDHLKKQLNKKLSDYNCNIEDKIIKKIVTNYFCNNKKTKYQVNIDNENFYHIDIYSPFFDILSKLEIFDEIFLIQIPLNLIKECRLKKDYITIFKKLNLKISSIGINIEDVDEIKYINDLKIDFNQLKKLHIHQIQTNTSNNSQLANKILSLIENANKLIYFSLSLNFQFINRKSYEFINNCKSLEYLNLRDIKFASGLTLYLPNLKKLDLVFCDNVILSKKINDKLNSLTIISSSIGDDKQLNFPELKKIYFLQEI